MTNVRKSKHSSKVVANIIPKPVCDLCGCDLLEGAGNYVMRVPDHSLNGSRWHLLRCIECGAVWTYPRPVTQLVGGYAPDVERDSSSAWWPQRLRSIGTRIEPGRLLDVGPGAGAFLRSAVEAGWQVEGLELQESFAEALRLRTDLTITTGDLSLMSTQNRLFDVVTMWDVLEHVMSPSATLRDVARIVRSGGLLAISTINAGSLNARIFGAKWLFWNQPGRVPEHLQGFTVASLSRALSAHGFEPVSWRTRFQSAPIISELNSRVPVDRIFGSGWRSVRRSVWGRTGAGFLWRSVGAVGPVVDHLVLGDILEICAIRVGGGQPSESELTSPYETHSVSESDWR